ncbi:hypothetical protein BDZ94DRAFT_1238920, partial [Collybia nuda]
NNGTMLYEFARLIKRDTGRVWDPEERCIKGPYSKHRGTCLRRSRTCTVVINIPHDSSSTSTKIFLSYRNQQDVDTFVYEIGMQEVSLEQRAKLDRLRLTASEWKRLDLFANLLGYAGGAQHAFSASKKTTLHLAIPALESLHKAWSTRANSDKYAFFQAALKGAAEKVNEYYEKTNNTDAYIVVMLLDPRMKKLHLLKHWPEELQGEAMDCVEEIFKTRYLKLQSTGSGDSTGSVSAPKR